MQELAREIANRLNGSSFVRVVTHIDADGISSGAIAKAALDRAGKESEVLFIKKLEPSKVDELFEGLPEDGLVWFCDLGSGALPELEGKPCVITDHHIPWYPEVYVPKAKREDLFSFNQEAETNSTIGHLNPNEHGRDGSFEISGAGVTYLVAREMGDNTDLAVFAIVGAVGDIQARKNRLTGINRTFLQEAEEAGLIEIRSDLAYYGRETRTLTQILTYANEPPIPTITHNEQNARAFLEGLGIELKKEEKFRKWTDLELEERKKIISALIKLFLLDGGTYDDALLIVGEVYILVNEKRGSPLRDAKEFSTLLNSTGRYGRADIGLAICLGDREEKLKQGLEMMKGHRANIVEFLGVIKDIGVTRKKNFSYIYTEDRIPEEVVGIIVGICIQSGHVDDTVPVFAFADSEEEGMLKISARTTQECVRNGIDLSQVLKTSTAKVGGSGGGHNIAAGGVVPKAKLDDFLAILETSIGQN